MNQVLHIFRKDTRRFWLEILVAGVIQFAYVWLFPSNWTIYHDQAQFSRMQQFGSILAVLVPVAWWLLVVRVARRDPGRG